MTGGGAQIVQTICLQTADAIARDDDEGRFVFRLPSDMPRLKPVKVALGSLEFPMTQWSVEETGNRLYYCEGFDFPPGACTLSLGFRDPTRAVEEARREHAVHLPPALNPIRGWRRAREEGMWVATCEHPHGLWSRDGRPVLDAVRWGEPGVVAAPMHTAPLGYLPLDGARRMHWVSETELAVELPSGAALDTTASAGGGYVHVPPPPNATALATLLTRACLGAHPELSFTTRYDARANRLRLTATSHLGTHTVELRRTALSERLGLGSATREKRVDANRSVEFESESLGGWSHVTVTPGWYAPAHRPMCPGAPLHICAELEFALNRLNFPLPERVPEGEMTAHHLVFSDPCGHTFSAAVPSGIYSPSVLAAFLQDAMSELTKDSTPGVSFSVAYADGRYTFSCEVGVGGTARPANFALLFGHPLQFDPRRIGFETLHYAGSSSYTSPHLAVAQAARNFYRVSEVGHQKRLRVHAGPAPHVTGIIQGYDVTRAVLTLRTHVGILPYVHGLRANDVVHLCPSRTTSVLAPDPETRTWVDAPVVPCPLSNAYRRAAVVLPNADEADGYILQLRVKPTAELRDCVGQSVHVQRLRAPLCLCVDALPMSLSSRQLGFRPGATQEGLDGSVRGEGGRRLPPLEAPAVHNLDHPDYVLMYLDEGKRGTLLQHSAGSSTTTPFAKIVLYPNLREERSLPRETTLISGESLTNFTVRFTNADGTPYRFHGANFSLSLNLIKTD